MKKTVLMLATALMILPAAFAQTAATTTPATTTPATTAATATTAPATTTPATATPATAAPATTAPTTKTSRRRSKTNTTAAASTPGKVVNVNSASAADLTAIPGVNAKIAADIIKNRPYKDAAELVKKVNGIGPKNVKKMAAFISF